MQLQSSLSFGTMQCLMHFNFIKQLFAVERSILTTPYDALTLQGTLFELGTNSHNLISHSLKGIFFSCYLISIRQATFLPCINLAILDSKDKSMSGVPEHFENR